MVDPVDAVWLICRSNMKLGLRQIVALFCLVALMCGGQASACVCDIAPAASECAHEHSEPDGEQHDHSAPGDSTQCPCATCHSCSHLPIALPGIKLPAMGDGATAASLADTLRLTVRSFDIFIPPKIS